MLAEWKFFPGQLYRKLLLKESHKKCSLQFVTSPAGSQLFWSDYTKTELFGIDAKHYVQQKINTTQHSDL